MHIQEARLALGEPIDPAAFEATLEFLPTRKDLVDFAMNGVLRILYLYGSKLPADLRARLEKAVLDFRPWLYEGDPPVRTEACYWTENHIALYASCEYLAGQMFPDKTFTWRGRTGAWHMEHARKSLLAWLGVRARYGFSEWLSPAYYGADIAALMNLVDLARDQAIAGAARGVVELALLDMALHGFDGGVRASSGRNYFFMLQDARVSGSGPVMSLAFGMESPIMPASDAAVALATSPAYHVPEAIAAIAKERPEEILIHERSGMSPEEAFEAGFRPEDPEDIFTFWAMQAYTHPRVFPGLIAAQKRWNFNRYTAEPWDTEKTEDNSATAMFGADVETYRTPDYQLSTAQDYRKGKPAFQQQIWLASLGGKASVWTSHPGADTEDGRPSYWIGNGFMPRAAQHKNLALILYRTPDGDPRPFSHVYFPKAEFDEMREKAGWLFGRKGDGYIAITARPGLKPGTRKEFTGSEWISNARESAWVCRMGRKAQDGAFDKFVEKVAGAAIEYGGNRVSYSEPEGVKAAFGWEGDLTVDGRAVPLHGYPRYESPYVRAARGEQVFRIRCAGRSHTIDLARLKARPFREMK